MGVRFLAPDCTHVPELKHNFSLGCIDYRYRPSISWRNVGYRILRENAQHNARLKCLSYYDEELYGESNDVPLVMHSTGNYVNTLEFGDEHPEYFAFHDGKRLSGVYSDDHHRTNPCPSHPEVKRIIAERVLKQFEENPSLRMISISYGDNGLACQCEECNKVNVPEKTDMAALLLLVNHVADYVKRIYPDKYIGVLAYWPTRAAPLTIKPRDNVIVMYCPIEISQVHEIPDAHVYENQRCWDELQQWRAICSNLYVWDYPVNFEEYSLPFPNLRVMGQHIRAYESTNVSGIFAQGVCETLGVSLKSSDLMF